MHRLIRDHLEEVLAAPESTRSGGHVEECEECRGELAAMREQAHMLRELRTDVEPRAGFYARVMERIEAQTPASIWNVFSESAFGRRVAVASMAVALLLGVYLVASEPLQRHVTAVNHPMQFLIGDDQPGLQLSSAGLPDRNAVLVNLVTYREQ
jgi:predicted anti-sigma-YlaC factor YlaD